MKILIVSSHNSINPFVKNLADSLSVFASVYTSVVEFFKPTHKYDIILFQWPEELTEWKRPSKQQLRTISSCINYWKFSAQIVLVRHNERPHEIDDSKMIEIYDMVYKAADKIVHLGEYSKNQLLSITNQGSKKQHVVIPHGNYNYPNQVSKQQARINLQIEQERFVILCFGRLRTFQEKKYLIRIFERLNIDKKLLLVPKWMNITHPSIFKNPIKRFFSHYLDFKYSLNKNYVIGSDNVKYNEVQNYFNAADLVLIPRIHSLNSGVLILAFNFGKPVMASASGNLTEIIEATGNYFVHQDVNLENLKSLGVSNQKFASENWNWSEIGRMYKEIFIN